MTLTKADLVQKVYQHHENMTKQQAVEAVEAFLRLSKNSLISGSDLLLSGFGKFNVRDKGRTSWPEPTDRRRTDARPKAGCHLQAVGDTQGYRQRRVVEDQK